MIGRRALVDARKGGLVGDWCDIIDPAWGNIERCMCSLRALGCLWGRRGCFGGWLMFGLTGCKKLGLSCRLLFLRFSFITCTFGRATAADFFSRCSSYQGTRSTASSSDDALLDGMASSDSLIWEITCSCGVTCRTG